MSAVRCAPTLNSSEISLSDLNSARMPGVRLIFLKNSLFDLLTLFDFVTLDTTKALYPSL